MPTAAVCSDCGDTIAGAVFVNGRRYLCGTCLAPDRLTLLRAAEPVRDCAWCGRAIVIASRDGRVKHPVCSSACRDARRTSEREHAYPEQRCPACDELFTPRRPKTTFCTPRCRLRAHRAKARKR